VKYRVNFTGVLFGAKLFSSRHQGTKTLRKNKKYTSRKFYNLMKIKEFYRLIFLTRTWKNGMMEYWNDELKKRTFLYLIPGKKNFTIT